MSESPAVEIDFSDSDGEGQDVPGQSEGIEDSENLVKAHGPRLIGTQNSTAGSDFRGTADTQLSGTTVTPKRGLEHGIIPDSQEVDVQNSSIGSISSFDDDGDVMNRLKRAFQSRQPRQIPETPETLQKTKKPRHQTIQVTPDVHQSSVHALAGLNDSIVSSDSLHCDGRTTTPKEYNAKAKRKALGGPSPLLCAIPESCQDDELAESCDINESSQFDQHSQHSKQISEIVDDSQFDSQKGPEHETQRGYEPLQTDWRSKLMRPSTPTDGSEIQVGINHSDSTRKNKFIPGGKASELSAAILRWHSDLRLERHRAVAGTVRAQGIAAEASNVMVVSSVTETCGFKVAMGTHAKERESCTVLLPGPAETIAPVSITQGDHVELSGWTVQNLRDGTHIYLDYSSCRRIPDIKRIHSPT
eukprot:Clim_evm56s88 gene=Clim_evmTU56s88